MLQSFNKTTFRMENLNYSRNILVFSILAFFVGCTNQHTIPTTKKQDNLTINKKNLEDEPFKSIDKFNQGKIVKTTISNEIKVYKNKRIYQKELLEILRTDKYASLCSSKKLYLQVKDMKDSDNKDKLLEKLLVNYTKNLANSCINIKDMNKKLAYRKAKKIKSSYKVYYQKVNENKILNQYRSNQVSIEKILYPYIPKHPNFKKLIKALHTKKLSKNATAKLRLNIERFKIMKEYNSSNFIELNIPSFRFNFYEKGRKSMSFGTVVGDYENQTPVLSSKLSYFIMNPAWNIPDSIAKKTIIPRMLKDKRYLAKKHIEIHKNYRLTSKRFKQSDIKWKKYLKPHVRYIPYKFIQLPSNTNGMGRVKFIFPNQYAVYMHDTIGTWRFKSPKQGIRAVSHGCVRLENPLALIKYISTHYTKRSYASVRKDYDSHRMKTVSLSKKLPVYITYQTAYVDRNSNVHFYKDLYGYDSLQRLNFK